MAKFSLKKIQGPVLVGLGLGVVEPFVDRFISSVPILGTFGDDVAKIALLPVLQAFGFARKGLLRDIGQGLMVLGAQRLSQRFLVGRTVGAQSTGIMV